MPIDTEVPGDPGAVRGAAGWARSRLGTSVEDAADTLYATRNLASSGWIGDGGDAFSARMTSGAQDADGLAGTAETAATGLDTFAAELGRAQEEMTAIRARAATAGLGVSGNVITEPGPAPHEPGMPPMGQAATPAAEASWQRAAAAADAHAVRAAAYETALAEAVAQREAVTRAADQLRTGASGMRAQAGIFLVNFPIAGVAGALDWNSSALVKNATRLWENSGSLRVAGVNPPTGTSPALAARDLATSERFAQEASDGMKASRSAELGAKQIAFRAGGALAIAGVAYDVIANDTPVGEAVVTGGVGFAASVATGAAIGTLIPVPGVGTALGVVGGAVVGVFASGIADTLYNEGLDATGPAFVDGLHAVGDTTVAIGGLAEDAWDALF